MDDASLQKLFSLIRYYILTITTHAGSGHPTSSLSAVELMTVLFFKYLRYDLTNPKHAGNDRVIFSKGHASPLYYALYAAGGVLSEKDLAGYRTFDSVLEGHPTERFKYTEAATGSLGQGLSIGLGEALALKLQQETRNKELDKNKPQVSSLKSQVSFVPRVFVLAGDGELAEGSVWEAAAAASYKHVDNLVLIADINRLGQSDPTMYEHDISIYKKRFEAFGWRVVTISDGNNLKQVDKAFSMVLGKSVPSPKSRPGLGERPTVILAKTKKGKGVSFIEDAPGWHGKPLSAVELVLALKEIGAVDKNIVGKTLKPLDVTVKHILDLSGSPAPSYDPIKPVATRKAFGNALVRLGAYVKHMVVLDGDVKNSTYTDLFGAKFPERFFEFFIAEQNMVGVAGGFAARGFHPVVSSFACFLTRAADQFRMAAFSGFTMLVNGSHAGVSIGQDGPSQMGLEDLAQFRIIHGSTVLYPSDAFCTERLVETALTTKGITYIRTARPETPVLYDAKEKFPLGGSKTHNSLKREVVTVIGAGITLFEALKAQKQLADEGIGVRVIDCYSVKPIDQQTLVKAARQTKAVIVVEDHYPEGGLGEAVKSALFDSGNVLDSGNRVPVIHLSVTKTPRSGKPAELLAYEEIDANAIIKTVHKAI
jgi:transketolase